ncbi:PHP domain-containing protein, partial [Candidatus Babeliales bacterium]|nr:PHP domain-containing protein [Candidatus Babeliales bacterium]
MEQHFSHLHVHTDHSLLDGAITIDNYIAFAKKNNLKALAITDHGNIFGAVKFFQKCKKAGTNPIIGIEAYLTEDVKI